MSVWSDMFKSKNNLKNLEQTDQISMTDIYSIENDDISVNSGSAKSRRSSSASKHAKDGQLITGQVYIGYHENPVFCIFQLIWVEEV